jgi:multidrug efflux system membrane fusion protein
MPSHLQKVTVFILCSLLLVSCSAQKAPDASAVATQGAAGRGSGAPEAGGGVGRSGGRGGAGDPVPVTTALVQNKAIPITIPGVGIAEALQTVQVRAQVPGQLSAVHFAEGQEVRKGEPLFTLDPRPFQATLAQAEAVLARDTATATNAASQHARYEDLYKRGLLPRDQYETQLASSESAQATLQADKAAVESARLNVQYTRIDAPITGRTGALGVHTGDLVRANDTTPMVVINQLAPIYVTFAVPGRYLTDIRRYQAQKRLAVQAEVQSAVAPGAQAAPAAGLRSLQSLPAQGDQPPVPGQGATAPVAAGAPESGIVTFIDNSVDATTGTIKLKGTFPNSNHVLWPGLFVQVTLNLSTEPNAIVVPAAAVQVSQNGQYVYVVKPDRSVEMRSVTIRRQQGEEMVIAQGLTQGEEVVTEGQLRLTPGSKVTTGGRGAGAGDTPGGAGGSGGQGGRKGGRRGNGNPS